MNNHPCLDTAQVLDTDAALEAYLAAAVPGMATVKPRVLLERIENAVDKPPALNLHLPPSSIGSVTLIEAAMLACLIRLVAPRCIFEFGTFRGYSTALFLRNSDPACKVISLDLGEDTRDLQASSAWSTTELHADGDKNDGYLRHVQSTQGTFYLSDLDAQQSQRLTLLKGDSRKFDVDAHGLGAAVDLFFIDGGHDDETIASDTRKAEEMAGPQSLIVWHDFNSAIHGDVSTFVASQSLAHPILHIQNTMLALRFIGPARQILAHDNPFFR